MYACVCLFLLCFFVCEYEREDCPWRGEKLLLLVLNFRFMLNLLIFQNMLRREGRSVVVFVLLFVFVRKTTTAQGGEKCGRQEQTAHIRY